MTRQREELAAAMRRRSAAGAGGAASGEDLVRSMREQVDALRRQGQQARSHDG